jgi:hypothetical protein
VRKVRIAGGAATVVLAGASLAWLPAAAQDGGPGPRMTFGLSQSFNFNDNLDLDVVSEGNSAQSFTGLSFGLINETEISSLVFGASTDIRVLDGPDSGDSAELDLDNTDIGLAYDRAVSNAALSVSGSYTMNQIDNALTLPAFGTGPDVPEDLGQLNGTGQRRAYFLGAGLSLGLEDPVSYELTAAISGLDYSDNSDEDLNGNNRGEIGAAVLFQLSPVDQGQIGLAWSSFNSYDAAEEDTTDLGLDLGVTRALPNGNVGFNIFANTYSDESDSSAGFSLSGAMDLPAGALSASIGSTALEGEDPRFTGGLSWQQELAESVFSLGFAQELRNNSDNQPEYVTGLRFGYDRELSPLSQLGLDISYARTEVAASPDQTQTATFSAVYSRALTDDWSMNLGYTYSQRDENDDGMARSNAVFFGISRAWELRP